MDEAKVALVTGSSSGIGEATADLLCNKKYKIVVTGSNKTKVELAVQKLRQKYGCTDNELISIVLDLRILKNASEIVKKVIERFGRLDLLVNNVGMYQDTNATDFSTFEVYRMMMQINVDSVVRTTFEAIPHLEKTKGTIIFVSSIASVKPGANNYAYRMTKAAISSYAKCLAIDIASKSIRVNIVSPGPIDTPMQRDRQSNAMLSPQQLNAKIAPSTLVNRIGKVEEVANVIVFLASNEASFVNGTEIFVDGGYLIKV